MSRILIERPAKNARITIFSARPGVVIGKKGEDIENLKAELTRRLGVPVAVNIEEVRKPEVDAQLIADSITQQLEKRIMFRRAMKRAMQNAMRLGAQGIKIMSSGRLNGIEIARCEWYREGRVPLHTLQGRHRLRLLGSQDHLRRHRRQVLGLSWRPSGQRRSARHPDAAGRRRRAPAAPRPVRARPGAPGRPGGRGRRPGGAAATRRAPTLPAADKRRGEAGRRPDAPHEAGRQARAQGAAPGAAAGS